MANSNDLNSVVLIGNLTRDLGSDPNGRDFSYTQSGMCVAKINIASNSMKKQADGSYGSEVSYFEVNLFGKTAENLKPYLTKGKKVAIEGKLKQERWHAQDGSTKSKIVINANSVQLLGGNAQNEGGYNQQNNYINNANYNRAPQNNYNRAPNTNMAPANANGFQEDIPYANDEEIPF